MHLGRVLRRVGIWLGLILAVIWTAWAIGALLYDLNSVAAGVFAVAVAAVLLVLRRRGVAVWILLLIAVTGWWFTQSPSNSRNWQRDVAELGWAEVQGDVVTIHNVRNFEYRSELDYTPRWDTRTVKLSELRAVDVFTANWGPKYIAHALVSFAFADGQYLSMSIEARKQEGEAYSAIGGFFRQYELIYIVSDERDVVRLRTNYREGETVRFYRSMTTPEDSRRLFLEYLRWMNAAKAQPEWYNAFTRNCSTRLTNYLAEAHIGGIPKWAWGTVLNGSGDRMLYDLGDLQTGGLSFEELRAQAVVNDAAKAADKDPDFSRKIRAGRVGFAGIQ